MTPSTVGTVGTAATGSAGTSTAGSSAMSSVFGTTPESGAEKAEATRVERVKMENASIFNEREFFKRMKRFMESRLRCATVQRSDCWVWEKKLGESSPRLL